MKSPFIAILLLAFAGLAYANDRVWPGADWETATPESQGISSADLAALVEYAIHTRIDSLLVTRHGRIVAEAYFAPYSRGMKHRFNSVTKTVVGALAGIAAAKGV